MAKCRRERSYSTDRVQTFIKYMKERVDNYILHPEEEYE